MGPKFEDVLHVRLGKLGDAVTDWTTTVTKLEKLSDEARNDMKAKSDKADWEGENAAVTRTFVDKTVKEFQDAVTQATSIRDILRDGHDTIKAARDDLKRIVENPPEGVTIWPNGVVARSVHPDRRGEGNTDPGPTQETLNSVRDQISQAVDKASQADEAMAAVLRSLVAGHPYDFGGDSYSSLRDYRDQQGVKEAEKALEMASKGSSMTDAELKRFNDHVAENMDNPAFAERFATGMGGKGFLEFYANLNDPRQGGPFSDERIEELKEAQENLSVVLAEASHSDSPAMRAWKKEVIELGPRQLDIPTQGNPYGFQVMSNLMHHGTYDKDFLNDYGDALVEREKEMGLPSRHWQGVTSGHTILNPGGADNDLGRDPMTGFMTALSRNPEASTEFFTSTHPQDNAQYVLEEREGLPDGIGQDPPFAAREAIGDALFAAATGIDPHDDTAAFVPHTDQHGAVLERSLKYLSATGDDFPPEIRDDMAKVLANHSDTVHQAASSLDPYESPLDRKQLLEVSKQVSRDQEAYGILNEGLLREMGRDINVGTPDDPKETLLRAGHTTGFLEEARYQALDTDKDDPSWDAKWGYHLVGGAANFIPVVGDAAQRGVDAMAYSWQLEEQRRIDDEISRENGENFRVREIQLKALAHLWAEANPDHPDAGTEYSLQHEIGGAAYDGNNRAKGLAGKNGD
ncbi:hypothetical protein L7D48_11545 [Streptomyces sp. S1A]|uniref:DUF6571 family protein n=1 Tax=Streptomyces sp. ICN903 TaxID=2964654 RepID=UPI001EDBE463|nr:DUF6571 family protein [Streptomyces sp. ICN903]MCG3041186.1 hypothetical protein [Streptomyces sp. ICN903]